MKTKHSLMYFLREIAIVVIGVLIAVTLSNYKEKADNEKYVIKTLRTIEDEIRISQSELDTIYHRHLQLLELLKNHVEDGDFEQTIGELVGNSGGFQVASIKNVSLRFFVANKAELLEFKLIAQLLEIEQISDALANKIQMFSQFAYEHVNENEEDVVIMSLVYPKSSILTNQIIYEPALI